MAMEVVQLAAKDALFENNPMIYSLNGRDFLTKAHLRVEIERRFSLYNLGELRLAKGRLSIDELPGLLAVGGEHVH